jgi:hypothetical protein
MIPLIRHYLWAFFFDEYAAKRLLVGLAATLGNVVAAILVFGMPTIVAWDRKTLLQHIGFAAVTTIVAMLPGPAITRPPEAGK